MHRRRYANPPLEIEPRLELANILSGTGQYSDEKRVWEELVQLDPKHGYALCCTAYGFAKEGDLPSALSRLEDYAALLPPNDPNVRDSRGDFFVINGHYEEGIAAYQANLESHPAWCAGNLFWSCEDKIALGYLYQGKYDLAESTALSNYRKGKIDARARSAEVLGNVETGRGRLDRAVGRYEEAARVYTGLNLQMGRLIFLKAAQIYFEQRQPQAALDLGLRHASPWAAGVRGIAYLLLKDSARAEKEFASLTSSVTPLLGEYWAGRIVDLHRLLAASYAGNSGEVVSIWQRAHDLPWLGFRMEIGRAYLDIGMTSEAERQLSLAIQDEKIWINRDNPVNFLTYALARFYQGKLLDQTGKKAEAINAYKEFLSHFENSTAKLPQIAEARAALKRLMLP